MTDATNAAPLISVPTPPPVDDADAKLIPIAKIWLNESALGEIVHEFKMREALRTWLAAKGV